MSASEEKDQEGSHTDKNKVNSFDGSCGEIMFIHAVAYNNHAANMADSKEKEKTTCGNAATSLFHYEANKESLVGYVKDEAWAYESEIRVRANVPQCKADCIFIDVPDSIFEQMIVTTGPRFSGDLQERLGQLLKKENIKKSLFTGKLNITSCDRCQWRHPKQD